MGLLDIFTRRDKPAPRVPQVIQRRNFEAAVSDRLNASWHTPNLSVEEEIRQSLEKVRNRARDLTKNNEFAAKYVNLVSANVVGPNGFSLQSQAVDGTAPDTLARTLIESAFYRWAQRGVCEMSGRLSWADLQRQVAESWARDGEVLLLQVVGKDAGNANGYALQLLEVDRLPVQYCQQLANGNRVVMGVELNKYNRPVAYWLNMGPITSTYASAQNLTRIEADRVIHIFRQYRAEQVRGMPPMAPVITGLKMLDGYEEAAIIAARVGASKMGFFTTPGGDGAPLADDKDEQGNYIQDADPGSFQVLPEGVQFQDWSPEYPHANYAAFMKTRLRSIASGLGVTYHGLANDLEGVNFSSIRSGTLEERDAWMVLQNWFIDAFLRPVFNEWLRWSLTSNAIAFNSGKSLPIAKFEKFAAHGWLGRRWGWVDPLKDIEASRLAVKSGIASPQMIAAQSGVDVEDVLQGIKDFETLVSAAGVTVVSYEDNTTPRAPEAPVPAAP